MKITVKKIVQILFFCFVSIALCVGQKAETIMDDAAKAYEKSNGISAQFAIHIQSTKQGISESFEGTIQMRGDKFVLITPDMRIWYDGTIMWTLLIATDEVNLTTPTGDDLQFANPMILFSTYKEGFNPSYSGESTTDSGRPAYDVHLTSKGRSDIEKIEVQIEKAASFPTRMTVYMKNDIRNIIRISKMQTGMNQPDSFFAFNPKDFPEVIEIDLR